MAEQEDNDEALSSDSQCACGYGPLCGGLGGPSGNNRVSQPQHLRFRQTSARWPLHVRVPVRQAQACGTGIVSSSTGNSSGQANRRSHAHPQC
jgi:hypothetical protein